MSQVGKRVQEQDKFLKSHTVLQTLLQMNSQEAARRGFASYSLYAHFGEEYNYVGAKLLTEWYRRNMRIHTNLINVMEPDDCVLVIFGAGHLGLLQQTVQADPTLKLRTLEEFSSATK